MSLTRRMILSHEESSRKHLVLLVALVAMLVGQPLFAHASELASDLSTLAFALVYVGVLFVVFETNRRRRIAYGLFAPVVVSNFALYATRGETQNSVAIVLHGAVFVFLGYIVVTMLRDLITRREVTGDHVLGAVAGYLLLGIAWSQVFALTYVLRPDAFAVAAAIAPQLDDPHLRSTLFHYFSFTTLTSIGYSDITPVGPPVYSFVWLEVISGQFYMAVVVAQLVGIKLAQLGRSDRQP